MPERSITKAEAQKEFGEMITSLMDAHGIKPENDEQRMIDDLTSTFGNTSYGRIAASLYNTVFDAGRYCLAFEILKTLGNGRWSVEEKELK